MAMYDLYGCESDDIHAAKKLLEEVLSINFDLRNSEYQGGEYFQWGRTSGEHFVLKRNIDPIDGGAAEMSFSAHKVLLYLNDTPHSKDLREKIQQGAKSFVVLRQRIWIKKCSLRCVNAVMSRGHQLPEQTFTFRHASSDQFIQLFQVHIC